MRLTTSPQKDATYAYKVSTGYDIITPGTSTVDHIRDFDSDSLEDFSSSQTQRR